VALSCTTGGSGWILEKFLPRKSNEALAKAAQRGGRVTVSRGIQETCRSGIWGLGLVGILWMDSFLDYMMSVLFSNLTDVLK